MACLTLVIVDGAVVRGNDLTVRSVFIQKIDAFQQEIACSDLKTCSISFSIVFDIFAGTPGLEFSHPA
jgi:hypothetical protein